MAIIKKYFKYLMLHFYRISLQLETGKNRKIIRIKDILFKHALYSTDYQRSSYIIWSRTCSDKSLTFYTDRSLDYYEPDVKIKVAWLLESPEITKDAHEWISSNANQFDLVLTHRKALLEKGEPFLFCPTGGCWIWPADHKIYKKHKSISIIASSKQITEAQKLRHKVIQEHHLVMSVYGRGYNPVAYKLAALKDYRFSIVIENTKEDYYFTEKLIDCFVTGTVPVYFGCPDIGMFFNTDGIVSFDSVAELDSLLPVLTEELYQRMQGAIHDNFQKAKKYLIAEDYIFTNYRSKLFNGVKLFK